MEGRRNAASDDILEQCVDLTLRHSQPDTSQEGLPDSSWVMPTEIRNHPGGARSNISDGSNCDTSSISNPTSRFSGEKSEMTRPRPRRRRCCSRNINDTGRGNLRRWTRVPTTRGPDRRPPDNRVRQHRRDSQSRHRHRTRPRSHQNSAIAGLSPIPLWTGAGGGIRCARTGRGCNPGRSRTRSSVPTPATRWAQRHRFRSRAGA